MVEVGRKAKLPKVQRFDFKVNKVQAAHCNVHTFDPETDVQKPKAKKK